ncbi:hypothetical protein BG015_004644 [Linnemannia schmuckeri]|uniref:Extracellular membrane protein CFEM domain-containing protein n=1 Tax=Linnemannia schmuckeri TaxID=64567 RepID=A0A9P5VCF0_9FUNG|nr:hypothetical protein BG015_004644 [Linnemannia schmuckeri]
MRLTTVSLTLSLAFAFLASAAPAPQHETAEQESCVDKCLKTEEDCLLESVSMSQCVIDFDTCHQICFPEEHIPDGPSPATLPAAPGTPGNGDGDGSGIKKHKDVTDQGTTDNDDDNDEDNDEDDQDENEDLGVAAGAAIGGGRTKVLHGKGKGSNGHTGVKAAAKEAVGLTMTPEEINRLQQSYTDEDDESIIDAPAGGEDAAEFDDDPSDY